MFVDWVSGKKIKYTTATKNIFLFNDGHDGERDNTHILTQSLHVCDASHFYIFGPHHKSRYSKSHISITISTSPIEEP